MARTRVVWKWEDENDDGEGVGPVWVDTLDDDSPKPVKTEAWDRWVPRSEAENYASDKGFEFLPDE
jgi:hypothetical protein